MKKLAAIALAIMLLLLTAGTASGENGANTQYAPIGTVVKDETVYISLTSGGEVSGLSIVNRLETPRDGAYTDYGTYESVTNLTNEALPSVSGDAITWRLNADPGGFYYQGRLKSGEPPFAFRIKYYLNGAETPAEELAGKKGAVRVWIKAMPNPKAAKAFVDSYMCQIQAALNLDKCANINAPKANSFVAGRTNTLSFAVLPEKEAEFELSFDTQDFAFGGFAMTALPFDSQKMIDIDTDELKDGIDKMKDGTQELIDGTGDLKSGLKELADGVGSLSSASKKVKSGLSAYKSGLKEYTGGVSALYANAKKIADALKELKNTAQDLKSGYAGIKNGVQQLFAAFSPTSPPELAEQMAYLSGKLDAYGDGLNDFLGGVSDLSAGMDALCGGIKELDAAGEELVPGLSSIISGMGKLAEGLSRTTSEMKKLPGEVQKMIDGQTELKDGIEEAEGKFEGFGTVKPGAAVSFASGKNSVRSVQFVYKTPEIAEEKEEPVVSENAETKKGFLEKFTDLFK